LSGECEADESAAASGLNLHPISTEFTGDIDLQGLLDLDPAVRPGYQKIKVKMDIQADCSDEALDALLAFVHSHSPVCDTLMRPGPVALERVRHG